MSAPVLEPELPIVDAHHHLWVKPGGRYLLEEYAADLATGHRVEATVYCESRTALRRTGPEALRPVGETTFAAAVATLAETGLYGATRVAAAIVAFADLTGDRVEEVLDAHAEAAGGRLRGVRHSSYWDADPAIVSHGSMTPPRHLLEDPALRRSVGLLGRRGLSFDAILFHHQLPELVALAVATPGTRLVLNHMGVPLGLGRFAGRRELVRDQWRASLTELARHEQVVVKVGGAGRPQWGFGFHERPQRPTAEELARAWRPYVLTCLELFGAERCMLESNFPADRVAYDYATFWDAMKLLTAELTAEERTALFSGTATRVYDLPPRGAAA